MPTDHCNKPIQIDEDDIEDGPMKAAPKRRDLLTNRQVQYFTSAAAIGSHGPWALGSDRTITNRKNK